MTAFDPTEPTVPRPAIMGTEVQGRRGTGPCEASIETDGHCSSRIRPGSKADPKMLVIHGSDDRLDLYCLEDPNVAIKNLPRGDALDRNIAASAALFTKDRLERLQGPNPPLLATEEGLCADEAFANQPSSARCSGVFISPTSVLTSTHCFSWMHSDEMLVVRGYRMDDAEALADIKPEQECRPTGTARAFNNFKLLLLDVECPTPPLTGVVVAKSMPAKDDYVYAVGHPMGIPAKFSGLAKVSKSGQDRFTADLDAGFGNSGSPVYNIEHELVGIIEYTDALPQFCSSAVDGATCMRWDDCLEDPLCRGADALDVTLIFAPPQSDTSAQ